MESTVPGLWVIAIGASGPQGLNDIRALLSALSPPLRAVALVVLHRPWDRPSHLRAVLAQRCHYPVLIADRGERFVAGRVYIGEPAQHLAMLGHAIGDLVDDPERRFGNRTVDLLFNSVAKQSGGRAIGVVLAGALDDGSRGLAAIHHAGGLTMVVTPSNGAPGMPENAIGYDGPIDVIGSPKEIADAITAVLVEKN